MRKKNILTIIIKATLILGCIPFLSGTLLAQQTLNIGGSITQFFEYDSNHNVQTKFMFSTSNDMNMSLSVRNVYLNMGDYKKIHLLLRNELTQKYVNCFTITQNQLPISATISAGTYSLQISPFAVMTEDNGLIPSSNGLPVLPIEGSYASFTATIKAEPLSGGIIDPIGEILLNAGDEITKTLTYNDPPGGGLGVLTTLDFKVYQTTLISLSAGNVSVSGYPGVYLMLYSNDIKVKDFEISGLFGMSNLGMIEIPAGSYVLRVIPNGALTPYSLPKNPIGPVEPMPKGSASATVTIKSLNSGGGEPEIPVLNIGDQVEQLLAFNGLSHIPSSYSFTIETDAAIAPVILNPYVSMGPGKCIYLNLYDQSTGICITGTPVCESGNTIELSQITLTAGTYVYKLEPFASEPGVLPMSSGNIGDLPIIEIEHANLTLEMNVCQPEPEGPTLPFIIEYTYDLAGNLTERNVIVMQRSAKIFSENDNAVTQPPLQDKILNIKIYPNPTKGQLKIEVPDIENIKSGNLIIYNMQGQMLINKKISDIQTNLDISSRPNGIYILQINIDGKKSSWKIIKE